jgi:hypothetical protein
MERYHLVDYLVSVVGVNRPGLSTQALSTLSLALQQGKLINQSQIYPSDFINRAANIFTSIHSHVDAFHLEKYHF